MKVVLQKVKNLSVTVDNQIISQINKGLLLLVGISTEDTVEDVSKLSSKILKLRVFEDVSTELGTLTKWEGKPWSKSVQDIDGEILSVSQFTLYGTVKKGSKPDFHKLQKGDILKTLYDEFLAQLRAGLGPDGGSRVKDGKFGLMMDVALCNDGPVTLVWDTREK